MPGMKLGYEGGRACGALQETDGRKGSVRTRLRHGMIERHIEEMWAYGWTHRVSAESGGIKVEWGRKWGTQILLRLEWGLYKRQESCQSRRRSDRKTGGNLNRDSNSKFECCPLTARRQLPVTTAQRPNDWRKLKRNRDSDRDSNRDSNIETRIRARVRTLQTPAGSCQSRRRIKRRVNKQREREREREREKGRFVRDSHRDLTQQ
jgi:hypothetical protein